VLCLAFETVDGLRQCLKASTVNPAPAVLADAVRAIFKLAQCLVHSFERKLNAASEAYVDGLLECLTPIVGHVIAVTDALIFLIFELLQLLLERLLLLQ
jgi:hypothetical protein